MRSFVSGALFVLMLSSAQNAGAQDFGAGIKAGVARATVRVQGIPGFEPKAEPVFSGGAFATLDFGRIFRIQPEFLVSTRRFESIVSFPAISATARTYEFPLLFAARVPTPYRGRPVFFAGPYLAAITRVIQQAGGNTFDISDTIDNLDAGVTFGVGLETAIGRSTLVVDVRANFGIRNLSATNATLFRTRGMAAHIGVGFCRAC